MRKDSTNILCNHIRDNLVCVCDANWRLRRQMTISSYLPKCHVCKLCIAQIFMIITHLSCCDFRSATTPIWCPATSPTRRHRTSLRAVSRGRRATPATTATRSSRAPTAATTTGSAPTTSSTRCPVRWAPTGRGCGSTGSSG